MYGQRLRLFCGTFCASRRLREEKKRSVTGKWWKKDGSATDFVEAFPGLFHVPLGLAVVVRVVAGSR